jgi:hypothetical protein
MLLKKSKFLFFLFIEKSKSLLDILEMLKTVRKESNRLNTFFLFYE